MSMQTQAYFCPGCYSDDYRWIDGKYTLIHREPCASDPAQQQERTGSET